MAVTEAPAPPPAPPTGRTGPAPVRGAARVEQAVTDALQRPLDATVGGFASIYDHVRFYGTIIKKLPAGMHYRKEIVRQIADVTIGAGAVLLGAGMLFVIVSAAFFTGAAIGLQAFAGLAQIGAQSFTGVISSIANTREITPLVAGVVLAAQVGTGFTAEIGAMRISDEIDALEVMGIDSFAYVVATRVWAALITMLPLYLAGLFSSYIAAQLIVTYLYHQPVGLYNYYFDLFLPPIDVFYSLGKAVLFAVVVTLIHCYYGYYASGGPAGVGRGAGRGIRLSIIVVTLLNLVMSLMFWGGKPTARITGLVPSLPFGLFR